MTSNISNGSRTCIVPLTLSMLDISSVPINSVHVFITQILTGFLADEKHVINCHFFLKSEKTKSISIFTWRIGLESKIFVQFIFFLTIEMRQGPHKHSSCKRQLFLQGSQRIALFCILLHDYNADHETCSILTGGHVLECSFTSRPSP